MTSTAAPVGDLLTGRTFVLTGELTAFSRKEAGEKLEALGPRCPGPCPKRLCVVAGEAAGSEAQGPESWASPSSTRRPSRLIRRGGGDPGRPWSPRNAVHRFSVRQTCPLGNFFSESRLLASGGRGMPPPRCWTSLTAQWTAAQNARPQHRYDHQKRRQTVVSLSAGANSKERWSRPSRTADSPPGGQRPRLDCFILKKI